MNYDLWDDSIPLALLESVDYKSTSERERKEFLSRLHHYDEIAKKAFDAAEMIDSDLLEAIDDIELDAFSLLSLGDDKTRISSYIIHSSWTFECNREVMAQYIVPDAKNFLSSDFCALMVSSENAKKWLRNWSRVMRLSLSKFGKSSSFTEAITHLIVIDALVSSYLVFASTARLNSAIGL